YTRQFSSPITDRPLDYSRVELPMLSEGSLDENVGVGTAFTGKIVYGPAGGLTKPTVATAGGSIDWNKNGSTTDTSVILDLDQTTGATGGCPASAGESLVGFNGWGHITVHFRAYTHFGD